jgi:hypothetical protein
MMKIILVPESNSARNGGSQPRDTRQIGPVTKAGASVSLCESNANSKGGQEDIEPVVAMRGCHDKKRE